VEHVLGSKVRHGNEQPFGTGGGFFHGQWSHGAGGLQMFTEMTDVSHIVPMLHHNYNASVSGVNPRDPAGRDKESE